MDDSVARNSFTYPPTIYVTGAARSGSTLLGEVLGAQPGVLNVGEISLFWRDLARGNHCACGLPIAMCPLWAAALDVVEQQTGASHDAYAELAATRARLARTSRPTELLQLRRQDPAEWPADVRRLVEATRVLVAAAARESGAELVVDTSKTTPGVLFLHLCGADYDLVHLVRRPEAVVSSTLRSRGVERGNAESAPPGGSLLTGVARWSWANLNALVAARLGRPTRASVVGYEDFVADGPGTVRALLAPRGIEVAYGVFDDDTVQLASVSHAAVGNPGRGRSTITLREDTRWRSELTEGQQRVIALLTAPARLALKAFGA
ncbi:sulfotransferase [Kytococcus sedentarius]|uniref:Sulfotransferase family protein n=1 Tax=Kytococcus sedentarius (strain ATCC 14392 / DSM 20547 / JCM 11482 / CCUG 33030 / NBRC 15357 / NCTC 11040 / CCM 314 / 541) TaxID=478801 RepID=C7NJU4_KYTSD|nr:sulfotransferase [Kytococcus sedentarius]ACV06876.1 hypothetical protein Ksed_18740 [Kytococcus sedentarius DSM 20547]QQB62892.1 sulfotransferase [Kytococcus sedentarius]STX14299.1 Uncharacterised protein [Kytococcus sedentarius]